MKKIKQLFQDADWTGRCWFMALCFHLSIFTFQPVILYAQDNTKTVTGTVTDAATGKPLAGVIVTAYGDARYSAMTDEKGQYELKAPAYTRSVTRKPWQTIPQTVVSTMRHSLTTTVPTRWLP